MFKFIQKIADALNAKTEEVTIMEKCPKCGSYNIRYKTLIINLDEALQGEEAEYETTAHCLDCEYEERTQSNFLRTPKFRF